MMGLSHINTETVSKSIIDWYNQKSDSKLLKPRQLKERLKLVLTCLPHLSIPDKLQIKAIVNSYAQKIALTQKFHVKRAPIIVIEKLIWLSHKIWLIEKSALNIK